MSWISTVITPAARARASMLCSIGPRHISGCTVRRSKRIAILGLVRDRNRDARLDAHDQLVARRKVEDGIALDLPEIDLALRMNRGQRAERLATHGAHRKPQQIGLVVF